MFPFPLSSFLGMGGGADGAPSSSSSSVFPQTSPEKISLSLFEGERGRRGKRKVLAAGSCPLPVSGGGRKQSVASKVFLWKVLCVLKRETKCGFGPPKKTPHTQVSRPKKERQYPIYGEPPPIKSLSFCESAVGDKESFGNFLATYTTFPFPLNCWRVKKNLVSERGVIREIKGRRRGRGKGGRRSLSIKNILRATLFKGEPALPPLKKSHKNPSPLSIWNIVSEKEEMGDLFFFSLYASMQGEIQNIFFRDICQDNVLYVGARLETFCAYGRFLKKTRKKMLFCGESELCLLTLGEA